MNNMNRKLLAMLLCLVLLAGLFPAALAEEPEGTIAPVTGEESARIEPALDPAAEGDAPTSGSCGENLTWSLDADGTLTVSGTGPMMDYEWDYDKETETSPWYPRRYEIRKLVVERGVTSIGNEAFSNCRNLKEVQLPDSLTRIGEYALQNCPFEEIVLPDSITTLDSGAFVYCDKLTEIVLPEGISVISEQLFYDCPSLTWVTIPAGVTKIELQAFYDCAALVGIRFEGTKAQWNQIEGLASIDRILELQVICSDGEVDYSDTCGPDASWSFEESSGTLTISGTGALWDEGFPWSDLRDEIRRVVVEEGITALADNSSNLGPFQDCFNLTQVSLPEGLITLGWRCFQNCDSLAEVALPASLKNINQSAFGDCDNLLRLTVPESSESFAFVDGVLYSKDMTTLVLCPGGKSGEFTVLDSVTAFGWRPFWGCRKLTAVHIPDTVTDLGNNSFQYCVSLKEVNIPTGVIQLPISCFYGCSSLEEITVPANVTSLYGYTFYDCPALKRVSFLGSAPSMELPGTMFDDSVTASVYYPGDDSSWTAAFRNAQGGRVTWFEILFCQNFPEPAFRVWAEKNVDLNGDGSLTPEELAAVTRMDVSGLGLATLEELRQFPKLQELDCSNNALTELDLSGNPLLTELFCGDNELTSLELSACPELERLGCYHNALDTLELRFCPALAQAAAGKARTGSFGADVLLYGGSGDAYVLAVDRELSIQDPDALLPITEEFFPDPAFRSYVAENLDPNKDGFLSQAEQESVTEIECSGESWDALGEIRSLKGIEYYSKLIVLNCSYNHISRLDLRYNPELEVLHCNHNFELAFLDVSACPNLWELVAQYTAIGSIDVSKNASLSHLDVADCGLVELDVSHNPELEAIYCYTNYLRTLDLSHNPALRKLNCDDNKLASLDVNTNPSLESLYCAVNLLESLDVRTNPHLYELSCNYNSLQSLDLSANPNLRYLYCSGNDISQLDVSANPELIWLEADFNQLRSLDLSSNPKLDVLECCGNQIEILDLSLCPALVEAAGTVAIDLGEIYGSGVVGYGLYDGDRYHMILDGSTRLVTGVIPGDLDADGIVESDDLLRMRSYLAGALPTVNRKAADVTGDGKVDILDLVRLRKYLAGMDVPLG